MAEFERLEKLNKDILQGSGRKGSPEATKLPAKPQRGKR